MVVALPTDARVRPEKALDAVVRCARSTSGKNGEGALPIRRLRPIQDDDPVFRIATGVRHMKKGEVAAIVNHQVERSGRQYHGHRIMLATVRENANVGPPDIRSQHAMRGSVICGRAASRA
jgi:hypothetical protein